MEIHFAVKTALTVAIIVGVSEIVKRNPSLGALIVALPLTSLLVIIWMRVEGGTPAAIAEHARGTFWFVLPTLPMFLILPWMLEAKWNFSLSLFLCCVLTSLLVLATERYLHHIGPPESDPAVEQSAEPASDTDGSGS